MGNKGDLYNNGAFRLINVNHRIVQNIKGNGCWQLGKGASLFLENGAGSEHNFWKQPCLSGQSVHFQDSLASLHIEKGVYNANSNFGAKCYGFGKGHAIEFGEPISSYDYDSWRGQLTVKFGGGWFGLFSSSIKIDIGTGYDSGKFAKRTSKSKYGNFNAIFYDNDAPSRNTPDQCKLSAPICTGKPKPTGSTTSSVASATSTTKATKGYHYFPAYHLFQGYLSGYHHFAAYHFFRGHFSGYHYFQGYLSDHHLQVHLDRSGHDCPDCDPK